MSMSAEKEKTVLAWSGGKDSALALRELTSSGECDVVGLLTTITKGYGRITMHGVREVLLEAQALSVGLPLLKISISESISEEEYEKVMEAAMLSLQNAGVGSVAFGDLFLEEVRRRREENSARIGMKAVFPLWGRDTRSLAHHLIDLGFKAVTTCTDGHFLGKDFVGRSIDEDFLRDLPEGVDPCGENGEFHSFVFDGPVFRRAIPFRKGDVVLMRDRFYYCDLIPS